MIHPQYAIQVPDSIDDTIAARAYINPVAAWLMLKLYSPQGKHILVTAGGADCAKLLCKWAVNLQALFVTVIYRSDNHVQFYNKYGVKNINQNDTEAIEYFAAHADIVFDAVGGELAETILNHMSDSNEFVSYGLLSGTFFQPKKRLPKVHWFHIRQYINNMDQIEWLNMFNEIWTKLNQIDLNEPYLFKFNDWLSAMKAYQQVSMNGKPLIVMAE